MGTYPAPRVNADEALFESLLTSPADAASRPVPQKLAADTPAGRTFVQLRAQPRSGPDLTITFLNFTADKTIWSMIEWWHPNCPDGGNWEKAGWWRLEPRQTAVVYTGPFVNHAWYGYAHANDGTEWNGDFPELVPVHAFQWCENTADSTSRTIGMFEHVLDSGSNWVWAFQ